MILLNTKPLGSGITTISVERKIRICRNDHKFIDSLLLGSSLSTLYPESEINDYGVTLTGSGLFG
jgi:hypothetical protein